MTDRSPRKPRKDHTDQADQADQPLNPGEGTTIQQNITNMTGGTVIGQQINYYPAEPTYLSTASALLIADPDDVPNLPPKLIGREDLLKQTRDALETHESVLLLQGFGGVGKTALAAWLAREYLQAGQSPVLWLEAGNAEAGALLEGLSRPFGVDQARAVASLPLDAGQHHVRGLLKSAKIQLVVLDNAWDGNALNAALAAIPKGIPALVTSRQKMPAGALIEVGVLSRAAALELLRLHAKSDGPGADELCELLGDHAYAVEIAGKTIPVDGLTPAELTRRIKERPHTLAMPEDFTAAGRESVARLIDVSLEALREKDETAYRAFLAFGAFFAPTLTAELLGMYFAETPESKAGVGEGLRPSSTGETGEITTALTLLARRGLAERIPATDDTIEHYRVHDLAHSYARAQQDAAAHERALTACLSYTQKYQQPSLANFAALRPTLDTLIGASGWALENGHYTEIGVFADILYVGTGAGGFLPLQGYYGKAITLLEWVIEAFRRQGDKEMEGAALGNLGNAYYSLGQIERAIDFLEQALAIQRETGDKRGQGDLLGNLGNTYYSLGQVEQAIDHFEQALAISREIGDRRIEGNQLGNLGNAYANLGQVERAIAYYEQALAIAREIGDKRGEGQGLGNLGIAHSNLRQVERAIDLLQQSLAISREIGDRMGEAHVLNNLASAYLVQSDYVRVLEYLQQARAIFSEISAVHLVKKVDKNITTVQFIRKYKLGRIVGFIGWLRRLFGRR